MNNFIPQNKQQAEEINSFIQNIDSFINLMKLSPEIGFDNVPLDAASDINSIMMKPYSDAISKKFNITNNNSYYIPDPIGDLKENIIREVAKGTLKGAQNINKGIKSAIQSAIDLMQSKSMQVFKNKLNNDLNLPKKWNDAFQKPSFTEIEITKPTSKYQGYINPLSKDNRIFTREDIGDFSTQEYADAEPMIMAQWGKIGIPTNSDLEHERLTNSGTVFVNGYTRKDGTKVRSYYRAA